LDGDVGHGISGVEIPSQGLYSVPSNTAQNHRKAQPKPGIGHPG